MFRHPRIERGESGSTGLDGRKPQTLAPLKFGSDATSFSSVGSKNSIRRELRVNDTHPEHPSMMDHGPRHPLHVHETSPLPPKPVPHTAHISSSQLTTERQPPYPHQSSLLGVGCRPCGFFPKAPGQLKKMERHRKSDRHRRRTNQDVEARMLCPILSPDGTSLCGRGFCRRDNLAQHVRKAHGMELRDCGPPGTPNPGELSDEGIVCNFCGTSFLTQESLGYHDRHCHSNPLVCQDTGPFEGIGGYDQVSPGTGNTGQRENLGFPLRQNTIEALGVLDNDVFKSTHTGPRETEWAAEEDQALIESRMKGRDWVEISSQLPGRSPESCLRRYQTKVLPQLGIFPQTPISGSDRSQNLTLSSAHVPRLDFPFQAGESSDSESEEEEKYSFPRVISTPEGDYLISKEQLPSEDLAASLIPNVGLEEANAFIDEYVGLSGASTFMDGDSWRQYMVEMVKNRRCSIRSFLRIMKEVRDNVRSSTGLDPYRCHQCGSSILPSDSEEPAHRPGLFSKCVMCRDHASMVTGIASHAKERDGSDTPTTVDREHLRDLPPQPTVEHAVPDVKAHISGYTCAPFTDSGYASGPFAAKTAVAPSRHQLQVSENAEGSGTKTHGGVVDDDSKTVYSAATSLDPACSRRYVQELSQDLYRSLQAQSDQTGWFSISQVVPDLVKAFAEKIGQEGHSQVHLDIMYFIHKRHREIISHLEDLFQEDRLDGGRKDGPEGMSLLDKMNLWNRKGTEGGSEGAPRDLFEGVPDENEEDDINTTVDLPSYNKIVLGCSAYSWLVSRLRKQCALQFGGTQISTLSGIRRQILEALPTHSISKRRAPQKHTVAFRFRWNSLLKRLQMESNKQNMASRIASIITASMASDDTAQIATVGDYFRQTWPLCEEGILHVLGEALGVLETMHSPAKHLDYGPASFLNQTTLRAIISGPHLVVSASGLADDVAEYGEQLAWLLSALRPSREGFSASAFPVFRRWDTTGLTRSLDAQPGMYGKEQSNTVDSKHRSSRYASTPSAVAVFNIEILEEAIPNRSPLGWWSELLADHVPLVFAKGFPVNRRPADGPGLEVPFRILQNLEHEKIGRLKNPGRGTRVWPCTGVKFSHRLRDVFYWCPNFLDRSPRQEDPPTRWDLEWETGRHVLQDHCLGTEETGTPSDSLQSSSPRSPTIDMVSLSSDSERVGRSDLNSPGFLFFRKLLGCILIAYQARGGGACGQGNGNTTGAAAESNSSSSGTNLNNQQKRKRLGPSGEDDDSHGRRREKRAKKEPLDCQRPRFACPFWKLDPNRHWECIVKKMTSISYVKQHLLRRHTPDFYCHRCYAIFAEAEPYDRHVVQASCLRDGLARFEGITQSQSRQLSKKVTGTVETQWFKMWDILFPHDARPRSIYVDSDQAVDLGLVREFGQRHGVGILRGMLLSSGLLLRPEVSEGELERVLGIGLDAMFEHFRMNRQLARDTEAIPPTSTSSDQHEPAPTYSTFDQQRTAGAASSDSAVAMGHSSASSFSSPIRHMPSIAEMISERRSSLSGNEGFLLQRPLANPRGVTENTSTGDEVMPAHFGFDANPADYTYRPPGMLAPSNINSEMDQDADNRSSDEASETEPGVELVESMGDGLSDHAGWEDLGAPGIENVDFDDILRGIVVDDSLLQQSLEWE